MSSEQTSEETKAVGDESQQKPIEWVIPDDGICEEYADWTYVNWLPLTVRIRFAQVKADPRTSPDKSAWVVAENAAITMPWATVKSLNDVLTKIIDAYEKTNGPITVPAIPVLS